MKNIFRTIIVFLFLSAFHICNLGAQVINPADTRDNRTHYLDSVLSLKGWNILPIASYGKVIIERFDSVGIDLVFFPNSPDTTEYIWFLTSETNDPETRSDGGSWINNPGRYAEPGSFENLYTIGMANYNKSHPDFSVIGFEQNYANASVAAEKFAPYWNGFVTLFKKVNNKYASVVRFKYGWTYDGKNGRKKLNQFEYAPRVADTQASYDYHFKAAALYPLILPSAPAKDVGN